MSASSNDPPRSYAPTFLRRREPSMQALDRRESDGFLDLDFDIGSSYDFSGDRLF